jgi:hypothetical protein
MGLSLERLSRKNTKRNGMTVAPRPSIGCLLFASHSPGCWQSQLSSFLRYCKDLGRWKSIAKFTRKAVRAMAAQENRPRVLPPPAMLFLLKCNILIRGPTSLSFTS